MASACIRNMTLSQKNNLNMIQQNCVIISSQNYTQSPQNNQQQQSTTTANKMTAIAPAPPTLNNNRNTTSVLGMNSINMQSTIQQNQPIDSAAAAAAAIRGYKKKYTYANMPYGEQPPSVARRNARERNRVKQVNNGFANLRQHIPQTIITTLTNGGRGASKKLSKVDTLRMAVEYINRLQELITDNDSDTSSNYNNSTSSGSPILQYNFPSSPDSNHHNHNFIIQSTSTTSSTYSEASVSPAPSCSSELSIGSNHHYGSFNGTTMQSQQQQQQQEQQQQQHQQLQNNNNQQFKYEPYDNYNTITDTTPEDEELLDYISSWQEQ